MVFAEAEAEAAKRIRKRSGGDDDDEVCGATAAAALRRNANLLRRRRCRRDVGWKGEKSLKSPNERVLLDLRLRDVGSVGTLPTSDS